MDRYICIHGHFYQPPRENPWLEAIELQDSAYPYHDWNERITAECYAANAASRIVDGEGSIAAIVNNYARISFNFGPTLLAWLAEKNPQVYAAILAADRESQERFGGHSSAMAQVYNHMILPLANRRDKFTQVLWGIRDFESRFGHAPEGMWLAETAADVETLDVLAEAGIRFTVLSPYQAARVRPLNGDAAADTWEEVSDGRIDTTRAYRQQLPSGRSIDLFFYDGPISRAIAFEGLLGSGESFAARLAAGFSGERPGPQLVHIATDGETYGHHHRHGEMALAYALHHIESEGLAHLTNYGEFLEKHPPEYLVEIFENTSWSCGHGVERWRDHCGCNSGGYPHWNQVWRKPLRAAFDWLRDRLAPLYEEHAGALLQNPWAARDEYVSVVVDRSADNRAGFLARHATRALDETEQIRVWKLLELQRHTMLMYTSCGWFFDELSGLETVQVIQYAGRAVQLAQALFGGAIEAEFLEQLAGATGNIGRHGDGRQIYENSVKPTRIDLPRVGAHYAVTSLFEDYGEQEAVYCYRVDRRDYNLSTVGRSKLAVGRARVTSEITQDWADLAFGVLHFGDHSVSGGVRHDTSDEGYAAMCAELSEAFERADLPEAMRRLDEHLEFNYPLQTTFRDEQRRITSMILAPAVAEAEDLYRRMYEQNAPTARFLAGLAIPLPRPLALSAEVALNSGLRQAFAAEVLDLERITALLSEARQTNVSLDGVTLGFTLEQTLERLVWELENEPDDLPALEAFEAAVELARGLPFEVNLWSTQNIFYAILQTTYSAYQERAAQGDPEGATWIEHFRAAGGWLRVRVLPEAAAKEVVSE